MQQLIDNMRARFHPERMTAQDWRDLRLNYIGQLELSRDLMLTVATLMDREAERERRNPPGHY